MGYAVVQCASIGRSRVYTGLCIFALCRVRKLSHASLPFPSCHLPCILLRGTLQDLDLFIYLFARPLGVCVHACVLLCMCTWLCICVFNNRRRIPTSSSCVRAGVRAGGRTYVCVHGFVLCVFVLTGEVSQRRHRGSGPSGIDTRTARSPQQRGTLDLLQGTESTRVCRMRGGRVGRSGVGRGAGAGV